MKNEHGFKSGILPVHCGKCVFLDWEECTCLCTHQAFVGDDDLLAWLCDFLDPHPSDDEIVKQATILHETILEDEDWHGYDSVCDLFAPRKTINGKSPAMEEARLAYEARAIELWRKHERECESKVLAGGEG